MRPLLLSGVLLLTVLTTYAQNESTNAPKVSAFSLSPDNLGAISNSVNLFTGQVSLPLNLASLPGKNELGINFSINYMSNVRDAVTTRNLEAPTSVLGLGWSLSKSQIIVDNKETGTRTDDDFYLVEGGINHTLVCIAKSATVNTYKTHRYQNWIIKYYKSTEKWEIIKDNGMMVTYGDQNSTRNTVQWIVKWGNWIGNSTQASNQQRQASVWDISEIKTLWGETIRYTYTVTEGRVGPAGLYHTQASYLSRIADSWGHYIDLVYLEKTVNEYTEPKLGEDDAFQERYETKYLSKAIVYSMNAPLYEIQFTYALRGSGVFTKRMLTSVTQVTAAAQTQTVMSFEYLVSGDMDGALYKVNSPLGGYVKFDYLDFHTTIPLAQREFTATAPAGYAEPQVFMADDYIVVTWREYDGSHSSAQEYINLRVYTWEGRWIEQNMGAFNKIKLLSANTQSHKVVTAKNFFALLKPEYNGDNNYKLYLYRYDENRSGKWLEKIVTVDVGAHSEEEVTIGAGDNYVAVSARQGKVTAYTWKGNDWVETVLQGPSEDHGIAFGHNYILSHATEGDDEFTMHVLDETRAWQSIEQPISYSSDAGMPLWLASPTFAFNLRLGGDEHIFRWDENYNFVTPFNTNYTLSAPEIHLTNSMITLINYNIPSAGSIRGHRFDGVNWHYSGNLATWNKGEMHAGDDIFAWTSSPNSGYTINRWLKTFNPNTLAWDDNVYIGEPYIESIGVDRVMLSNMTMYRSNPNELWSYAFLTPQVDINLPMIQLDIRTPSTNYMLRARSPVTPYFIRNGQIDNTLTGPALAGDYMCSLGEDRFWNLSNQNSFVLIDEVNDRTATSLKLYRVVQNKATGSRNNYPVSLVTVFNGNGNFNYTSIDYNHQTAVYDPTFSYVMYNKVSVHPGSMNASTPNGSTEYYFFNGLDATALGGESYITFDMADCYKLFNGVLYKTIVKNSLGVELSKHEIAGDVFTDPLLEESTGRQVDMAKGVRTQHERTMADGVWYWTDYSFNATTWTQISAITNYTWSSGNTSSKIKTKTKYWWEIYDPERTRNILTPVVQLTKLVDNVPVGSEVIRYKDWTATSNPQGIAPSGYDTFVLTDTTSIFTNWDIYSQPATPRWKLVRRTQQRDPFTGMPLEESVSAGISSAVILNNERTHIIASAMNAKAGEIGFTSFEDAALGNFNLAEYPLQYVAGDSHTGNRHLNLGTGGITKPDLLPANGYILSFWAKSNGGVILVTGLTPIIVNSPNTWKLYKIVVRGSSSYNIKRTGTAAVAIDDVRIQPVNSQMTTYTHHPVFGETSRTDDNDLTVFTTYDSFGRHIGTYNSDRDLLQTKRYHIKP